jgi:cell division septal protein FtsQ
MASRRGRRQRRFRILPSIVLTIVILLLPAGVYAYGRYAGAFKVKDVVLTGAKRVPAKKALAMLTTRYRGRNLFTISTGDILGQLKAYPYFRAAKIDRDFPDTLRVSITEYQPAAYLLTGDGWYVVTTDGYVIAALRHANGGSATTTGGSATTSGGSAPTSGSAAAPATGASGTAASGTAADTKQSAAAAQQAAANALKQTLLAGPPAVAHPALPAVFTAAPVTVGQMIADQQVLTALRVVASLPVIQRRTAAYAAVTATGAAQVVLRSGLVVALGDDSRLTAKALALKAVLAQYAHRGVTATAVDVSVPDRPLAKPRLPS